MKNLIKNNTLAVAIVALIVAGGAIAAGSVIEKNAGDETHETQAAATADRAFIEEMIPHHESAIAMAELAEERAESEQVKTLASSIIRDQQREITQMKDWYQQWYGTEVPAAAGGEHGGGHGGMTAEDDISALQATDNFDLEFVRRMIPHHESAVTMAEAVLPQAKHQETKDLAQAIIASQSAEITQMRQLEAKVSD